MVRRKQTIDELLKKVNHRIFMLQDNMAHSILYRLKKQKELAYLKGESYALAWALNKVEPYGKKKTYHPGPKETYCRSGR